MSENGESYADEVWRPVADWPGYQVSTHGRIKTKRGRITFGNRTKYGYMQYTFHRGSQKTKDYKRRTMKVHRVVAMAFIPTLEGMNQINHIDNNRSNNHVSNLHWCNAKLNNNDPLTIINKRAAMKKAKNRYPGEKGYVKVGNRYRARIWINRKQKHIGIFDTELQARNAYLLAWYLKNDPKRFIAILALKSRLRSFLRSI